MVGGAAGKLVMAFEAEGTAATGELVEAVEAEVVEGVAMDNWFGGSDGSAFGGAAEGGGRRDCWWREAEAVANVEDKFGVGEKGSVWDAEA